MMHAQEEFVDSIAHGICKAVAGVLNHHKDPPTCMMEDQRNFIVTAIKTLHQMGTHDKDFVTELLVQFLDGDKEVRYEREDKVKIAGFPPWQLSKVSEYDQEIPQSHTADKLTAP